MGGLGKWLLPPEDGGDTGQIPVGDGVEVDVNGTLFVHEEEDDDGEIDRFNMECAILVWELDGRMIDTGVEAGGGESDPNRLDDE